MRSKTRHTGLLVLAHLALGACGQSASEPDLVAPTEPASVASLLVEQGNEQTGVVGALLSLPLTVRALDADGAPVVGATVAFRVTAGQGSVVVPRLATDTTGRATAQWQLGLAPGTQAVAVGAVTAQGDTTMLALATATAVPGPVARVAFSDSTLPYLDLGEDAALGVIATDTYGNAIADPVVTWSSSDTTVLSVASDGRVSAMAQGRASVTAQVQAMAVTRSLLVRPAVHASHPMPEYVSGILAAGDRILAAGTFTLYEWDGLTWRETGVSNEVGYQAIISGPAMGADGSAWVALGRAPWVDRALAFSPARGSPFVVADSTLRYVDAFVVAASGQIVAGTVRPTRRPNGTLEPRPLVERLVGGSWTDLAFPLPWPGDSSLSLDLALAGSGDEVWYGGTVRMANSPWRPFVMHYDGSSWKEIPLSVTPGFSSRVDVLRGTGGTVAALVRWAGGPELFRLEGRTAVAVPVSLGTLSGDRMGFAVSPTGRLALLLRDGVAWEVPGGWMEYPFSPGETGNGSSFPGVHPIAWTADGSLWVGTNVSLQGHAIKVFRVAD